MKNFISKLLLLALASCLASCSTNTPRENKALGTTVGAAAGTALGAASGPSPGPITVLATGAIVGALIGSTYGNSMEKVDKEKAYQVLASGKPATWQNPNSKVSYTVIPAANYASFDGNPHCRQFSATQTYTDGNIRKINRTACRGALGDWQLVR